MKALLISRTFYPEGFGGGEISALHIAKALNKSMETVVCCLSEKTNKLVIENVEGVKIYRFPWKKLKFSKKLSNLEYVYWQMHKATKKVIKKEKPDVLHFLNYQSIFPLAFFFKRYPKFATINSPFFCEFGGSHSDGKSCYNCSNKERITLSLKKWGIKGVPFWLYNRYSQFLLKTSLKKCRRLFPVSNAIKKMLISKGIKEEKIKIIHNPISKNKKIQTNLKSELGISEEKKIIFYAGRLSKDKGIHKTIKAIKDLENIVFLVVGKKRDHYIELKALVKELGLEKRIIFLGFIDNKKLQEYFSITDLVVHPCTFYEPLSRMLLEATSYGLPIIASDVGGNSEIVENNINGFLISNEEELKEKIKLLITNDELARDMGKNSQKGITQKFNPQKISEEIIKEYKRTK